ncbi:hypothetical protein CMO91_01265 [Candidatus Woesearchaeota archaeon]|nr:hypothetical protein [Candidatus Woesearchaeota archaeon]
MELYEQAMTWMAQNPLPVWKAACVTAYTCLAAALIADGYYAWQEAKNLSDSDLEAMMPDIEDGDGDWTLLA